MPEPDRLISVIHLWSVAEEEITCSICGKPDQNRWGIPVSSETALIVANDFDGEWGCKPACRECWARHENGEFVGTDTRF